MGDSTQPKLSERARVVLNGNLVEVRNLDTQQSISADKRLAFLARQLDGRTSLPQLLQAAHAHSIALKATEIEFVVQRLAAIGALDLAAPTEFTAPENEWDDDDDDDTILSATTGHEWDDDEGESDGVFKMRRKFDHDGVWVGYIVGVR